MTEVNRINTTTSIDANTTAQKKEYTQPLQSQQQDIYVKGNPVDSSSHDGGLFGFFTVHDKLKSGTVVTHSRFKGVDYSYQNIDGKTYEKVIGDELTLNNVNNVIVSGKFNMVNGLKGNDNIKVDSADKWTMRSFFPNTKGSDNKDVLYSSKTINGKTYAYIKGDCLRINNANNVIVSGKFNMVNGTQNNDTIMIENGEQIYLLGNGGDDKLEGNNINNSIIENVEDVNLKNGKEIHVLGKGGDDKLEGDNINNSIIESIEDVNLKNSNSNKINDPTKLQLKDSSKNQIIDTKHKSQLYHTYDTWKSKLVYGVHAVYSLDGIKFENGLYPTDVPATAKEGDPLDINLENFDKIDSIKGLSPEDLKDIKQTKNFKSDGGTNNSVRFVPKETEITEK